MEGGGRIIRKSKRGMTVKVGERKVSFGMFVWKLSEFSHRVLGSKEGGREREILGGDGFWQELRREGGRGMEKVKSW